MRGLPTVSGLPYLPRSPTFRVKLIELHLVFKRVHGREEALVRIRQELLPRNQTLEGLNHEFLAIMDMIEDLPTQHKEAAIDAEIGIGDRLDVGDLTVGTQSDRVEAEVRLYGEEASGLAAPLEHIDELGQAHVGEAVAVIREEDLFILEVLPHGKQALPDIGRHAGIHERNIPVMNVAVVKLHSLAAAQEREVVRDALAVLEKVVFDGISAITEAQDEVLVSEVSIVLHDVPENRPVADRDHGLRDVLGIIPESHAHATAEEHDLHRLFPPFASMLQVLVGLDERPHADIRNFGRARQAQSRQNHLRDVVWLHQQLGRSEEHTSELQSRLHLVCRLLLEKKK